MKNFIRICKMDKNTLKDWLYKILKAKYGANNVVNEDGFLFAKGNGKTPILLTAHMDTVHKQVCDYIKITKEKGCTMLTAPKGIGGDDRCGIWIILNILTHTLYRPTILFCEDEEIGGIGSSKFVKTEYVSHLTDLKYLVEVDRANDKDAVYYDCGNLVFQRYIEETIGYKKEYGSFTDICHLSPVCDRASVNLSCGYYRQHTLEEYVIFEEMVATYKAVKVLLSKAKDAETYDYQEEVWYGGKYGYGGGYTGKTSYGYDYNSYWEDENYYEIVYKDEDGKTNYFQTTAVTKYEALGYWASKNINLAYSSIIDMYQY